MYFFFFSNSSASQATDGRTKRGALLLYSMVKCSTGCDPLVYKGYGCYCGFLGSGRALDGIDRYVSRNENILQMFPISFRIDPAAVKSTISATKRPTARCFSSTLCRTFGSAIAVDHYAVFSILFKTYYL